MVVHATCCIESLSINILFLHSKEVNKCLMLIISSVVSLSFGGVTRQPVVELERGGCRSRTTPELSLVQCNAF